MLVTHRILFVIFDQFELLDLSGPSSVFIAAQALFKYPIYSICTLSSVGELVCSRSGIEVNSQTFEDFNVGSSDTILIVGGEKQAISKVSLDPNLNTWLALNVPKAERFGYICSGALVLAENGLLNDKNATTHWVDLEQLVRDYPSVEVEQYALYCVDGNIWTSAGVTTGIDMSLAMVCKDHDRKVMQEIASWLVVYAHRPGHQSQFSELLAAQNLHRLADIVVWLDINLHKPLKVKDMAERTFYRRFTTKVGCTPLKFLEIRRLFRAKQLLETGSVVKTVSTKVGYKSALGFRNAFEAKYGLFPALYKRMHC
ncbi:MAG: transcriptional regulator GlxA family with amidase domain [Gammaproteobacteria bacterium]|jgi:transcriptional regulator GlxA family with amidase domain